MSTSHVLQQLYSLGISSTDLPSCLHRLIQCDEQNKYLSGLQGSELTRLVDFLDDALGVIPTTNDVYRQCLHKLQTICGHHGTLPSSHNISGDLAHVGEYPISVEGGTADVWEGTHGGKKVCIKRPRVCLQDLREVTQSFLKEAVIWKRLRHPNIVPFIGVTRNPLQFVSEYLPNGTLTKWVKNNPSVDRIALLLDVAEGLNYLHTNYTIHGDLKGPNILVDHNGNARLTDFGLTSVVRGLNSVRVTEVKGYTEAWAAPEVLQKGDKATPEADIFSFGMVVIEVFTGMYPFSDFSKPVIVLKITDGERPTRPREAHELGLTDSVWNMTLRCWGQHPVHRPTVTEVVEFLRECYRLRTFSPPLSNFAPSETQQHSGETTSSPISVLNSSRETLPVNCPPSGYIPSILRNTANNRRITTESGAYPENLSPKAAKSRMDRIAKELARRNTRPGGEGVIELMKMCGYYCTVPASYELEGVTKEGDRPQSNFQDTEIWKGKYNGEAVVLKILRGPGVDSHMGKTNSRFCKKVVLMKQFEHGNILPFYGVSAAVADFCLVFPRYENGSIMEYLKRKPDICRFTLLSGVARGLSFLHQNRLVHGALSSNNVLIDDNGVARLAPAHHHSILAVPGTSTACHLRLWGGVNDDRYPAPELHGTKCHDVDWPFLKTQKSDVYGIGMVIYEVLTGDRPYSNCDDIVATSKVQAGEFPQRPSDGIPDPIWTLLETCWSRDPSNRPSTIQVYDALSRFRPTPTTTEEPPHADNDRTVQIPDVRSEGSISGVAQNCIDEITEELACVNPRPGAEGTDELRTWCKVYRSVPTSYKLEGVVREGDHSQRISQEIEIWKGRYKDEVVALKVPRVSRQGFDVLALKSRFCSEAVRMNQLEHGNIIPCYGVSTTVADICLVYPWYENGNIADYLKKNPDVNRFDLLSGAANGLRFAHENNIGCGFLRPSHVLVDDSGAARLEVQSARDVDKHRYSAPEITLLESGRAPSILAVKEGDVYGMGMIAYEVLTGNIPYSGCDDAAAISNIQARKSPKRPSEGIYDPVWLFLRECWSMEGRKRPTAAKVYDSFSKFRATEELPEKLKLEVQSIDIPFIGAEPGPWYQVVVGYGGKGHAVGVISRRREDTTRGTARNENIWNTPQTVLIKPDKQRPNQLVSVRLVVDPVRSRTCAKGRFSLLNNVNGQVRVKLETPNEPREGVVEIRLTAF